MTEQRPAASKNANLIEVRDLRKTFLTGVLFKKRVHAVRGVSFEVEKGEIFGFLGPNGAGKTTTIKILMGLIAPTSGTVRLFDQEVTAPSARTRIGFLPENPYVYPYLTPREFVELSGRLSGMRGLSLRKRTSDVLDRTGILYAADRPVRKLSKGMLQRTGLAAALVSDPEMLVLDEPMSGLDPVGRKEVRDLIFDERKQGRTIFFSTHILSDVEAMCDRVAILRAGEVVVSGEIRQLLKEEVMLTDIVLSRVSESAQAALAAAGFPLETRAGVWVATVQGEGASQAALRIALDEGARVIEVAPRRETLEDLFMKRALGGESREN